jgi:hypothetical protein
VSLPLLLDDALAAPSQLANGDDSTNTTTTSSQKDAFASDLRFRAQLRPGFIFDCCDYVGKWYPGKILARLPNDMVLVTYDGWSAKFDEAISARSRRLAPFLTHTRAYLTRKRRLNQNTMDLSSAFASCFTVRRPNCSRAACHFVLRLGAYANRTVDNSMYKCKTLCFPISRSFDVQCNTTVNAGARGGKRRVAVGGGDGGDDDDYR